MERKDELFQKFVENELTADEEREVLHMMADDRELRSLLQFELKLKQSFRQQPDLSTFEVPQDFSDSVMQEIENRGANAADEHTRSVPDWLGRLWQPQQVQWRPAYAAVLALLVAIALSLPVYNGEEQNVTQQQTAIEQSVQAVSETSDVVRLRFVYIDGEANSVAVAGDFSNWEPVPLTRQELNGQQVWTGLVSMSRGEHRYMFVKNGDQWITDPLAPMYREDGFGNKNAVIYI